MTNANTEFNYPVPTIDSDNRPYLEGWRKGLLLIQKCQSCHSYIFYPKPMCSHCWSTDLSWEQATGKAEVVSYSLVHRPNHSSFAGEVPIALAEIKLEEGVAMLARILSDNIYSGMKVQLMTDSETTKKYPLPVFKAVT